MAEMNTCLKCGKQHGYSMCPCYTRAELLEMGIDPDCGLQSAHFYETPGGQPENGSVAIDEALMAEVARIRALPFQQQGQLNWLTHKITELEQRQSKALPRKRKHTYE